MRSALCRVAALFLVSALVPAAPAVRAQPDNLEVWRAYESPSFRLYSDADAGRSEEILVGLERFRTVFAQLAPELVLDAPAPSRIIAFHSREAYAPYKTVTEERGTRILGQFLSHPDGIFITLDTSSQATGALGPIYHEFVHFFVRNSFNRVPLWLHEGLAEYYSTFATDGKRAWVGLPVDRHLRWLRQNADLGLDEVLELTNGEHGSVSSKIEVDRFYAVSWALVHYLMSGGDDRLGQMAELLVALDEGIEADRAFARAFEASPDRVEESLRDYLVRGELPSASVPLDSLGRPTEPRRRAADAGEILVQLGGLLAIQGRTAEAEAHYDLALDQPGGGAEAAAGDALAGVAHLRAEARRTGEADILFRDAVELSPSEARSWLWYGRHLLSPPEAEQHEIAQTTLELARRVLARAVAIEPGYAEARALLGYTYLFGDAPAEPGIAQLAEARRRLPARMDLAYYLFELYLKDGDFTRARDIVAGVLEPRAEPELSMRAREELDRAVLLEEAETAIAEGRLEEGLELLDRAIDLTSEAEERHLLERRLEDLKRQRGR